LRPVMFLLEIHYCFVFYIVVCLLFEPSDRGSDGHCVPVFLLIVIPVFWSCSIFIVWLWYDFLKIRSEPFDQSYDSDLICIWAFLSFNFSTILLITPLVYLLHLFYLKKFPSEFAKNIMLWFICLATVFYYCYLIFVSLFYIILCIFYFSPFYFIIIRSLVCIIGFVVI